MRLIRGVTATLIALALAVPGVAQLVKQKPPYFGSISPERARMRTGPGRSYPVSWEYRRADLPVKVLDTFEHGTWLKIEDPGGTQGWMLASLISSTRTGMVMGDEATLREAPAPTGRVLWRAAPNVVGRVSRCLRGWCWFDVKGQAGYVEANRLWGVDPAETLP